MSGKLNRSQPQSTRSRMDQNNFFLLDLHHFCQCYHCCGVHYRQGNSGRQRHGVRNQDGHVCTDNHIFCKSTKHDLACNPLPHSDSCSFSNAHHSSSYLLSRCKRPGRLDLVGVVDHQQIRKVQCGNINFD